MCYVLFGTGKAQQHWYIKKIINLCMFCNLHSASIWSCGLEKKHMVAYHIFQGPSWSWSYGSLIYNYLCNQCLSPLTLWVRIMARCTTLCDNVCQWFATGQCFFSRYSGSSTNKTDRHDITLTLTSMFTFKLILYACTF